MANLPARTSVTGIDGTALFYVVKDPGGTPVDGKITLTQLKTDAGLVAGTDFYSVSAANAAFAAISHNHAASEITSGTFTNARVAETNVTQHQSALTILESQISDLGSYITASSADALTNKTFDANGTGNSISNIDPADLSATGTPSSSTYLRGDNTWATIGGGGDVSKVGTPVNDQIGIWTGDGTIEGVAALTYDGTTLNLTQGIKFTERADHASTPAATFGEIWVKNDAPNNLMFTDDAGTDHQVAMLTPGSSSNLSDKFSTDTKTTPAATNDYFMMIDPDNASDDLKEHGVKIEDMWANSLRDKQDVCFVLVASDETTALTTGTDKVTFRVPHAFTVTGVRASVNTAPTGSVLTVDINEGGTSILSTKLTIDATETTSTTAATAAVISDSAIADDAELSVDIDTVGSTVAGAGLKVTVLGTRG